MRCGCIPPDAYRSLVEMTNVSLLKDPVYILFIASNVATTLGFYIPYFYLPDRAKELGVSEENVGYMLATIGIANTFGRIILGYISDRSCERRLLVYKICLFSCGIGKEAKNLIIFLLIKFEIKIIFRLFIFYSNGVFNLLYGSSFPNHLCSYFWIYDWCLCWLDKCHSGRFDRFGKTYECFRCIVAVSRYFKFHWTTNCGLAL